MKILHYLASRQSCIAYYMLKKKGEKRIGLNKHIDVVIDNKKLQNEVSQNAEVCMIKLKKGHKRIKHIHAFGSMLYL